METSRAEQINTLRNHAILTALESALALVDTDNMDVRCLPFRDETEERTARAGLAPYVNSYIVGPLLDAVRYYELGSYDSVTAPRAADLIERLDQEQTKAALQSLL